MSAERGSTEFRLEQIRALLERLGFEVVEVGGTKTYRKGELHLRVTHLRSPSALVIESAGSRGEAERNVFEDSDLYPDSWPAEQLVSTLESDLRRY